jgi:hypothetical protein
MGVVRQWMSRVVFVCGGVKWVYGHLSGDWHVEGKAFKQGTMSDNSVSTRFTRTTNEGRGGIHRRALSVFKIRLKCTKDLQARGCCLSRRPTFSPSSLLCLCTLHGTPHLFHFFDYRTYSEEKIRKDAVQTPASYVGCCCDGVWCRAASAATGGCEGFGEAAKL